MQNYDETFKKIVLNSGRVVTDKEKVIVNTLMHSQTFFGYDRINDPEHVKEYISKIPEYKNVSLEEAILDSVNQLDTVCGNRMPTLLLSGGIDSTLVFYALLLRNKPFNVVNDTSLIIEYQDLFQQLLNNKFPQVTFYRATKYTFREFAHDPGILCVTGEIGDQLMGSMVTMELTYEERMLPLIEAVKIDLFRKLINNNYIDKDNFTEDCITFYKNALTWLNKTENDCTVAEFLWAVNFIYKYLLVIYRLYTCDLIQYGPNKNTYHFFDTEKFQQYAISHYEENCRYVKPYEYKQPLKDWIYSQNHDEEYRRYKLKEPSLKVSSYWGNRDLVQ